MKFRKILITPLLTASLTLLSFPANSATYIDTYATSHTKTQGVSYRVLPSFQGHFCYLSNAKTEETDLKKEWARCKIYRNGGSWILEARLGRDGNSKVWCDAMCFSN